MDVLQLVFAFINAPLFATFLLGMFWRRANGHGAFYGLVAGTACAAIHHGLTIPAHALSGIKGGWLAMLHQYPSEMAQNFWTAIFAFSGCFSVTALVSLMTHVPDRGALRGLVYSETPRIAETGGSWLTRTATLGCIALAAAVILNWMFW